MTVVLTAPKDLQQGSSYEEVLELLHELHDGEEVVADRDLFEDNEHWRKSWRSIYSKAERLYVLALEDGTVGKGIFQQWRFLSKKDVPGCARGGGLREQRAGVVRAVLVGDSGGWRRRRRG